MKFEQFQNPKNKVSNTQPGTGKDIIVNVEVIDDITANQAVLHEKGYMSRFVILDDNALYAVKTIRAWYDPLRVKNSIRYAALLS